MVEGGQSEARKMDLEGGDYFLASNMALMAADEYDLGRSRGMPSARSQISCETTPCRRAESSQQGQ